jgi:hypothetical protein
LEKERNELEAALAAPELSEKSQKTALKYLDAFLEIINDPDELKIQVIEKCRGSKPSD